MKYLLAAGAGVGVVFALDYIGGSIPIINGSMGAIPAVIAKGALTGIVVAGVLHFAK